jgi:hypothetical protein
MLNRSGTRISISATAEEGILGKVRLLKIVSPSMEFLYEMQPKYGLFYRHVAKDGYIDAITRSWS